MRANNKIPLIFVGLLFGCAATTGIVESRELEREKLLFFSGNEIHSWCQSNYPLALGYTSELSGILGDDD
jgi:hypothetical protein